MSIIEKTAELWQSPACFETSGYLAIQKLIKANLQNWVSYQFSDQKEYICSTAKHFGIIELVFKSTCL